MFSGKIYRNKPIELEHEACKTEYEQTRSPLRKVLSNGQLLQTFSSNLDLTQNEEMHEEEKNKLGAARLHVQKSERRMKQRINSLERMYTLSLEELEKTLGEKDAVISALKQALEEKDKTIEALRRQNDQALQSSRLMLPETFAHH